MSSAAARLIAIGLCASTAAVSAPVEVNAPVAISLTGVMAKASCGAADGPATESKFAASGGRELTVWLEADLRT